ncbi:ABC-type transport auxiliary lipoprotein family protein [Dokdonella sp.]|uniref:ABC-type transport auxiliary lipoprotein family protein n=1 Tax=Dokdonella sp. TaxID=2291710 RepID=UPI0031BF3817|nr:PqiC family protein [Dokdonella sp.]
MKPGRLPILLAALLLAACGGVPAVPDYTWYRLPPAPEIAPAGEVFALPVVVGSFAADGLYADQALIHALDASGQRLRQYHYQLWVDPPGRMLQRRLIARLRDAALAPLVTDELAAGAPALRIRGVILRMERVPDGQGGTLAVVALKLRVDAADRRPLVDQVYRAEVRATDGSLGATVAAMGTAIDELFARFQADLVRHADQADAP